MKPTPISRAPTNGPIFPWTHPFRRETSYHKAEEKDLRFLYGTLDYEYDDIFIVMCAFVGYGGKLGNDYDASDAAYVIFERVKVLVDINASDAERGTYTKVWNFFKVPTLDTLMEDMDQDGQDLMFAWANLTNDWPCEPVRIVEDSVNPLMEVEFLGFDKLEGCDALTLHGEHLHGVVNVNYTPRLWPEYRRMAKEKGEEVHCRCMKPDDGKFYYYCQSCDSWFHDTCTYVNPDLVNELDLKVCAWCDPKNWPIGQKEHPIVI